MKSWNLLTYPFSNKYPIQKFSSYICQCLRFVLSSVWIPLWYAFPVHCSSKLINSQYNETFVGFYWMESGNWNLPQQRSFFGTVPEMTVINIQAFFPTQESWHQYHEFLFKVVWNLIRSLMIGRVPFMTFFHPSLKSFVRFGSFKTLAFQLQLYHMFKTVSLQIHRGFSEKP